MEQLTGRVIRPDSPAYTKARTDWDGIYRSYPMVIVFAQTTEDVVNAITWARQNDIALRVRSGRHSLEGWSNVTGGIVIDVSEMKSARLDPALPYRDRRRRAHPGEAVTTLGEEGFAVPTGREATVGLAGATLGGGFGFLTRNLGMACDNLMAAEVVVPSGDDGAKAITADEHSNSDLLWALRGRRKRQLRNRHLPHLPDAPAEAGQLARGDRGMASRTCKASSTRGSGRRRRPTCASAACSTSVRTGSTCCSRCSQSGSPAEARELLAPILSVGNPDVSVQAGSWGDIFAGLQPPSKSAMEPAKNWKFFSQFITEPYPAEAIDYRRQVHEERALGGERLLLLQPSAARSRRRRRGGSAFPHRDALFYAEPGAGWNRRRDHAPRPRPGSPSSARRCGPT